MNVGQAIARPSGDQDGPIEENSSRPLRVASFLSSEPFGLAIINEVSCSVGVWRTNAKYSPLGEKVMGLSTLDIISRCPPPSSGVWYSLFNCSFLGRVM